MNKIDPDIAHVHCTSCGGHVFSSTHVASVRIIYDNQTREGIITVGDIQKTNPRLICRQCGEFMDIDGHDVKDWTDLINSDVIDKQPEK